MTIVRIYLSGGLVEYLLGRGMIQFKNLSRGCLTTEDIES